MPRAAQLVGNRTGLALRSLDCQFRALSLLLASSFRVKKLF